MKNYIIPLNIVDIPAGATPYIQEIFRTKRLTYGKFTRAFEKKFAAIHGNRYGVMVNSGTSALQITFHALKIFHRWQDNDEVILPALTFVADPNVIILNNLQPVFVDVHPEYYDIDVKKIESAIGPKTRAILVPHLFGQPADMDAIQKIAKKHNLILIEDACESPFAVYQRHSVGHWGEITCFSTHAAHIFSTGVGGIAITQKKPLATLLRSLAFHGRDPSYLTIDDRPVPKKRFSFPYRGYSYRVTELEGAIGLAGLKQYRQTIIKRQQNARYLLKKLKPLEHFLQMPKVRTDATHVFMVFPIVIRHPALRRDHLVLFLEKKGIETRNLLPLISQSCYGDLKIRASDFPVAQRLSRRGFYIGCHPGLTHKDLDYIVKQFFTYIALHEKTS